MYLDHQHSQHQLSQTTLNKKNTLFRHKMEAVGTICEGEWSSSFNGMGSDEADFMAQLLGNCSLPNAAAFWGGDESEVKDVGVEETNTTSTFSFSLGNSMVFPSSSQWSYYPFLNNNSLMEMDLCMMDGKNNAMEGDDFLNQDASNDSIVSDEKLPHPLQEDKMSSKKRPRVLGESQRSKKLRKSVKVDENENENDDSNNASSTTTATKVMFHRQSSSSFCSEDESNASHEANGVNSSGKTRASRGSATDPQSLYARKRRERINERLKVLQSLVPNGTKVDISTMLEEAVQYVKFLQLQIKLLSSDDMWMYAPIAYHGMDIGLDFKIPSPKSQT